LDPAIYAALFPAKELNFANAWDAAKLIAHISGKIVA
jgi:hypothetical protein